MKETNERNSVVGGMAWKMGERLISQGVSFVVSMILARLLMPDDYGTIALVQVFINLSAVFLNSGFATSLIQKKDADDTDFSTIYYCSQLCAVALYVILFFCAPLVAEFYDKPILVPVLRVFSLQVPLSAFNSIQLAYVSRHMQFGKVFAASFGSAVVSGAVGIAMAYAGFGIWALVTQSVTATVVSTLVMFFIVPWRPKWAFSWPSAKALMKYGSRVLGADLSGTFFGEVRSLIIGRVYTSADLAFYSKGQQLPTLITSNLSTTLMTVLFPAMANRSDDIPHVKQMAKRCLGVLSFILVPCMLGLAAVMEPLVLVLFSEKWAQVVPYGQVLCVGYCVGVFGVVSLQVLKAIGRSDVVLALEVWKKPAYVLLLIVGVNINVFAVAVTMALYDIYGVFINMVQMKKYIGYGFREQLLDLLPAFGLGTVMAAVVLLIPSFGGAVVTLAVKVAAGALLYVGGAFLFRVDSLHYLLDMLKDLKGGKPDGTDTKA